MPFEILDLDSNLTYKGKTNDEQIYYYNSESVRVKDLNCSSNRIVWLEMIRWYNHAINIFMF